MKIKDLQAGQGNVDIEVTVKSIEQPRTINKYGKDLRLANAIVTDGSDEVKLTLWNDDVDKVKVGSILKIEKGYVSEFQGEKQLTTGKFGKMTLVDGSSGKQADEDGIPEETYVESEEDLDDY
jgi:replication factor A1